MNIDEALRRLTTESIISTVEQTHEITLGAGGARIYRVLCDKGDYVFKFSPDATSFDRSYRKEIDFYSLASGLGFKHLPEIVYSSSEDEEGSLLVMKYCQPIAHSEWDNKLIRKACDICASFASLDYNILSQLGEEYHESVINPAECTASFKEWEAVLNEHPDKFKSAELSLLDDIHNELECGLLEPLINSEPHIINHGDYHPENILRDGDRLVLIDWQNVCVGNPVGDISFFINRGADFGIYIDDSIINYYSERLSHYIGRKIEVESLIRMKNASSLHTSFYAWPFYLHGSPTERVSKIFNEMVNAYKAIT